MIRKSMTEWQGDGPTGSGSLTTESGALRAQPYSFKTRFQSGEDSKAVTNPEELLGAAHAACFAMTVAFILTEAGHAPKRLKVTAAVDISKVGAGFAITSIALDLEAHVEGLSIDQFRTLTEAAKTNCPVSKALSATPISLTARLA
jgi:lipoyl-dependent peroxiredoxin